ncbi:hypothetical protein BGZ65_007242, partial [Modicella reniformis]
PGLHITTHTIVVPNNTITTKHTTAMEMDSPFDEWSRNVHAVITFLKPFFDDWRSYASLLSALLGVGVLIMENQVLLRMRMGRWEILGYVLWCIISSMLGPIFDIVVMLGLLAYCRHRSARMHITNETIAKGMGSHRLYEKMTGRIADKIMSWHYSAWDQSTNWALVLIALLPAPVAANYRIMGIVCITASFVTLCSNWSLCILYLPVRYMLLELCDIHRDSKHILIPLEILVDIVLYNGPFLAILLRLLYLAWQVAYDEAVLTGAIYENESSSGPVRNPALSLGSFFFSNASNNNNNNNNNNNSHSRRHSSRPGANGYVGLAMEDLEEAEQGHSRIVVRENGRQVHGAFNSSSASSSSSSSSKKSLSGDKRNGNGNSNNGSPPAYESRDSTPKTLSSKTSPRNSSRTSLRTTPKTGSPLRNVVIFNMESSEDEDDNDINERK